MRGHRSLLPTTVVGTGDTAVFAEQALIRRARSGDTGAFALVVARHERDVGKLALRMLGDYHAAEDVSQETFFRAYGALATYVPRATMKAWLLRICRNLCLDVLRDRARHANVPLDEVPEPAIDAPACADRVDLRRALANLPRDELEAVLLLDLLQYRSGEAASVVGVPASTLRSRASRARMYLAQTLQSAPRAAV